MITETPKQAEEAGADGKQYQKALCYTSSFQFCDEAIEGIAMLRMEACAEKDCNPLHFSADVIPNPLVISFLMNWNLGYLATYGEMKLYFAKLVLVSNTGSLFIGKENLLDEGARADMQEGKDLAISHKIYDSEQRLMLRSIELYSYFLSHICADLKLTLVYCRLVSESKEFNAELVYVLRVDCARDSIKEALKLVSE
jgi:hypothetical protein